MTRTRQCRADGKRLREVPCTVQGCERHQVAKGYCGRHYMLNKRNGSPLVQVKTSDGELMKWLKAQQDYTGDECLFFPYARAPHGYAQVKVGNKLPGAHRLMCEWVNGPPPHPSYMACHSCGNGHLGCVTPRHLSWKTRKGNAEDTKLHKRLRIGKYAEPSIPSRT